MFLDRFSEKKNKRGYVISKLISDAENGNSRAQRELGYSYYMGDCVSKDMRKAYYWFKKAAEQGDSYAKNFLGICYYRGDGVEQNFVLAAKWLKSATDDRDGAPYAYYYLGECYYYGIIILQ